MLFRSLVSTATGMGETGVSYMWQVSADTGKTWTNVTQENINSTNKSEIMISGIGYGKYGSDYDGTPKFIEIYALEDADLRDYRIRDNISNGYTYVYSWVMNQLNIQMKKGEYLLIYGGNYNNSSLDKSYADAFFGKDINELYDYTVYEQYFYYTMRDGKIGRAHV